MYNINEKNIVSRKNMIVSFLMLVFTEYAFLKINYKFSIIISLVFFSMYAGYLITRIKVLRTKYKNFELQLLFLNLLYILILCLKLYYQLNSNIIFIIQSIIVVLLIAMLLIYRKDEFNA